MGNFQRLEVWQRSKELAVYLYRVTGQGVFAKGSSAELITQLIIANEIGCLVKQDFDHARNECQAISKMLTRLIQARSREVP